MKNSYESGSAMPSGSESCAAARKLAFARPCCSRRAVSHPTLLLARLRKRSPKVRASCNTRNYRAFDLVGFSFPGSRGYIARFLHDRSVVANEGKEDLIQVPRLLSPRTDDGSN